MKRKAWKTVGWALMLAVASTGTALRLVAQSSKTDGADVQPQQIATSSEARPPADSWPLQDRIAWGANLLLALAGYAGIAMGISLLKKIERQTRATETAADAAGEAAHAALLEAQTLRTADRPWVLISSEPSRTEENTFKVVATNRGGSPARIVASAHGSRMAPSEENLPAEPEYSRAHPGEIFEPIVLLPGESVALESFGREDLKRICVEDGSLQRVDTWEQRVYVFGRFCYRDLRDPGNQPEFETRWCFWYVNGRQRSGLVAAGRQSYHMHS